MWDKISVSLAALILISGCAVGVKHNYVIDTLLIEAEAKNSFVVGTLDHRAYVLNSRKNENFVGLSRGGFGNPFDVTTLSGNPLATDISESIALSLRKGGVDAEVLPLERSQSVTDASKQLFSKRAQRTLLLTLREWKGDSMMRVSFTYDFDLNIFDQAGSLLVKKQVIGDEVLGSSDPFTPGGGDKIGTRFRTLMQNLFDDPEVTPYLN
jgi:hypothetical protein